MNKEQIKNKIFEMIRKEYSWWKPDIQSEMVFNLTWDFAKTNKEVKE